MKKIVSLLLSLCMVIGFIFSLGTEVLAYEMLVKGIDVSVFQGNINWSSVASSGIKFAIIRCGTTNISNANYTADNKFVSNYDAATSAGIAVGTYMYTSANSQSEMKSNVQSMLNTIAGRQFSYPVYLDVEQATRQTSLGKEALTDIILYGLRLIKEAGYTAGVYANQNWFNNYVDRAKIANAGYEIWLARYPSGERAVDPAGYDYSSTCAVWQYSSKGSVSGISGNVDVDVAYKVYPIKHIDSGMSISGETIPKQIEVGSFFGVYGDITSNLPISLVWGGVYYDDWTVTSEYAEYRPDTTIHTFSLYPYFDDRIIFNHLSEGIYHYLIKAKDSSNQEYVLINEKFTVGNPILKPQKSELTANTTSIVAGGSITFTATSDSGTSYTIGIDKDNERIITQEMPDGKLTLTFNDAGTYSAYVTASNSSGFCDSEKISFTVSPKTVTIKLNGNGGKVSKSSFDVQIGSTLDELNNITATNEGYSFGGWFTEKVEGTQITVSDIAAQNMTLYAHWSKSKITITLTFDALGGEPEAKNKTVTYGSVIGTLPDASRDGYIFAGWYWDKAYEKPVSETDMVEITESTTVYARWIMLGDSNLNGVVDIADVVCLQKHLICAKLFDKDENYYASDVLPDSKVDAKDLTVLKRMVTERSVK